MVCVFVIFEFELHSSFGLPHSSPRLPSNLLKRELVKRAHETFLESIHHSRAIVVHAGERVLLRTPA